MLRVASRIVGVVLALAGLGFLVVSTVAGGFDRRSVLVESGPERPVGVTSRWMSTNV
jgi:hypothetical protein